MGHEQDLLRCKMQNAKCKMYNTVYLASVLVQILLNQDFLRYVQGICFFKLQRAAMNENLKLEDAYRRVICVFLHMQARLSTRRLVDTNWLVLFVHRSIDKKIQSFKQSKYCSSTLADSCHYSRRLAKIHVFFCCDFY